MLFICMSHSTGWQGERKIVWEPNLAGKKASVLLKMFVSEPLTKILLKRYSTDELLPSNFTRHISEAAVRCRRAQWVSHRGAARLKSFPCDLCRLWGPSAPCLSQDSNKGQINEVRALSRHKVSTGVLFSPQCVGRLWEYCPQVILNI